MREEARRRRCRRHRRERWAGAVVAALAVLAGLAFGLSGGGAGAGSGRHHRYRGTPGGATHQPSRAVAVVTRTPYVMQFGLMAPRVGWAANGAAFYLTRNGGRAWDVLSRDTQSGSGTVAVHGLGLNSDIGADITATSSPSAGVVAIGFIDGAAGSSCRPRRTPAEGAGAITLSGDGGRSWSTHILPGCNLTSSLSFINARVGYAVLGDGVRDTSLYRTDDGGRRWRLVSRFPAPMTVSFGNAEDGLALVTTNNRSAAGALYRTTDGGRSWQRSSRCGATADPTRTVYCGAPTSFGSRGVVLAIAQDLSNPRSDQPYVYTTTDAARRWSRHAVPPLDSPEMPSFSAANASDLFVYSFNGVLDTSTNGGRSWRSLPEPSFKQLDQMQFISADYGWVVARGHFEYTTDGGRSWRAV